MGNHRVVLLGTGIGLTVIVIVIVRWSFWTPGVTVQNFRHLAIGMSQEQCDRILRGDGVEKDVEQLELTECEVIWTRAGGIKIVGRFVQNKLSNAFVLVPRADGTERYDIVEYVRKEDPSLARRVLAWFGMSAP